jgi:hypothetical protein
MRRGREPAFGSVLLHPERFRVDARDLVRAEEDDVRHAPGVDHDPVGPRARRRRGDELDLARLRVEPADHVRLLQREVQHAVGRERERVRVLRVRVGHAVLGDLARSRIQLADERLMVAGEEDVAVAVLDQPVRAGGGRLKRILLHLAGLRIDAPEPVGHLSRVPDRPVARRERVVRPRAGNRHLPFADRDPGRSGKDDGVGLRFLRQVLRQVVGDGHDLVRRNRHAEVDHHPNHGVPVRLRVARVHHAVQAVAAAAELLDLLLPRAVGQGRGLGLAKGHQRDAGGQCERKQSDGHAAKSKLSGSRRGGIMKRRTLVAGLALSFATIGCSEMPAWMPGSGWTTLVDGEKGLENFDRLGDANWRAEGGAIVADKAKDNSYLVTKKSYKDFQIRAEFWAERNTNSGIFIRIQNPKKVGSDSSYEVNIYDQRPGPEYATGGIVNFAKVPVPPIYKAEGKWNTFEITAKGSTITVLFNAQKTVELQDSKFPQGPFALQFGNHGKQPGDVIKWRKVQVREL